MKILIIGSGPIVIGQACEFDYSGSQACRALREEGISVVLVNSNPATIMTDPEMADAVYVEPITPECVAQIIEMERPDALLPTMGGQTALNTAVALHENGVLEKHGVKMIGASFESIQCAENRQLFRDAMGRIGLEVPRSAVVRDMDAAHEARSDLGLPVVIRPSFTMGGTGGGIAYNREEFIEVVAHGMELSPTHEVLIEESVLGWKEFELEVMRDSADNCVVICSIENLDPMGVHTGDSITVAPAQTLTDREYQVMRDAAFKVIREIGVETGGSNIQFAVDPKTGRMVVIEMNPRVSRSSALASKATGFPIARIAAQLAIGKTLDEIDNRITHETPASFEPTLDYVVVKVPRFAFEKFPNSDPVLTTQMKSVGEVMAMGRTFPEAFGKALRGLETGHAGWDGHERPLDDDTMRSRLVQPHPERIHAIRQAMEGGMDTMELHRLTGIDPWFLDQLAAILKLEARVADDPSLLLEAKRGGLADLAIARLWGTDEKAVRAIRTQAGIRPVFSLVDTCGAEFHAATPYYYSTYESVDETRPVEGDAVIVLGGGPNRIGQGIEFDYCCCHASAAIRDQGLTSVMVNCNPETVSTDFDTSDLLFFEPLTVEDVLEICEKVQPIGVVAQFGGQTPLHLAQPLEDAGVKLLGTSPDAIDRAEDRERFNRLITKLGLRQPLGALAIGKEQAVEAARSVGYPVLVRPSYVLGGRGMALVYTEDDLLHYLDEAVRASANRPLLVDKFLEDAIEVDVDAVADGQDCVIGGIMEHIELAGIHSGDSSCVLPPFSLGDDIIEEIRSATHMLALELGVRGLLNIQFAVKGDHVYVIEVHPRASRPVPFVSKTIHVPLAKVATRVALGASLEEAGFHEEVWPDLTAVKMPVFPFSRFPGTDTLLGPEMRSTGEVMGVDQDLGRALAKAFLGAGTALPASGRVFISVKDADKRGVVPVAQRLADAGFSVVATEGTWKMLRRYGVEAERVLKIHEGRPNVLDMLSDRQVDLILNTPLGRVERSDDRVLRAKAAEMWIPSITTLAGAEALAQAVAARRRGQLEPRRLGAGAEAIPS